MDFEKAYDRVDKKSSLECGGGSEVGVCDVIMVV